MTMAGCSRPKQPPLPNNYPRISYAAAILHLLFILFFQHPVTTTADVPDEEKKALLSFIKEFNPHESYSWDKSTPVCVDPPSQNWKGVKCLVINSVTHLSMPAARLAGVIPPGTIGNLKSLRVLTLRQNSLYGTIPQDFSNLKLTHLNLFKNNFSGNFPNIQTDDLVNVDVSRNNFTGDFPYIQSKLLEYFDVSRNNFTGQLPNIESAKLQKFDVSINNFSGSIPESLAKFPDSAFSKNKDLCGGPLRACESGTVSPPPHPAESEAEEEKNDQKNKTKQKRLIVGVSIGSALILLVFLCCLRKRLTKQSKLPPELPVQNLQPAASASKPAGGEENKLVFLEAGIYSFDMEDLYRASTELLGKGSVGTSLKAVMDGGSTTVVLKRLKHVVATKKEFESRMEVLGKMKNQHLIPLVAYYYSKDEKLIVYDYMPAGSLFAHLHNGNRDTRLDWERRMRIALSAARGVEYLHVVGKVVHGNIKSSNILFRQEANKDASVSDYGLNILFDTSSSQNHQVTCYQAPEVLNTREVTFESDVYSFGVLLLELLTGKDPNQTSLDKDGIEFPRWVQSITHEELKAEGLDVELRRHQNIEEKMVQLFQIAKDCLLLEPNRRPTMHKVVRMMEDMNRVEIDEWVRQSSDDHSKPFDDTPSTETRDTPSTITP